MLFLLEVQGRDPIEAGLVLAPLALVSFVVSARWRGGCPSGCRCAARSSRGC